MAFTCAATPAFLESDAVHDSNCLVAHIDPRGRDCSLGTVFWSQKCLPDAESSFYFAGVTYTTVGYGDLLLPKEWRLFGPLEGLTGILMCGLSTAFFFAVLSKRFAIWSGGSRTGSHAVKSDTRRGFDSPHPLLPLVSEKVAPISSASARSAPTEAGS
jgi:hypothetical protein